MESKHSSRKNDGFFVELSSVFRPKGTIYLVLSYLFIGIIFPLLFVGTIALSFSFLSFENFVFSLLANLLVASLFLIIQDFLSKKVSYKIFFIYTLSFSILINAIIIYLFLEAQSSLFLFISSSLILPIWLIGRKSNVLLISKINKYAKDRFYYDRAINYGYFFTSIGFLLSALLLFVSGLPSLLLNFALLISIAIFIFIFILKSKILESEKHKTEKKFEDVIKSNIHNQIFKYAIYSRILDYFIFLSNFLLLFIALKSASSNFNFSNESVYLISLIFVLAAFLTFFLRLINKAILNFIGIQKTLYIYPIALFLFLLLIMLIGYGLGQSSFLSLFFVCMLLVLEVIIRIGLFNFAFSIMIPSVFNEKIVHLNKIFLLYLFSGLLFYIPFYFVERHFSPTIEAYWNFLVWFIMILVLVLTWVVSRLYILHKSYLLEKTEHSRLFSIEEKDNDIYGIDILARRLYSENINEVKLSALVLSEVNPKKVEPLIPFLFKLNEPLINRAILSNLDLSFKERVIEDIDKYIINPDERLKKLIKKIKFYFEIDENIKNLDENAYKFQILKKVRENPRMLNKRFILRFNEEDKLIIRSLIGIMAEGNSQVALDYLTYWLTNENYMHYIADNLVSLGDDVLPLLDNYFYHAKPNIELLIKIVEIYGKIASPYAIEYLISHANFPDNYLQTMIIKTLVYIDYQPDEEQKPIFIRKIYFIVQNISWLLTYREKFATEQKTFSILPAIDNEIRKYYDSIFLVLEILYNKEQIAIVKKNLKTKNPLYASEILSSILSEDIKNIVLPLIENIPNFQKIRKLNSYFPVDSINVIEQLKELIKANPLRISDSTRAKAIEVLASIFRKTKFNKWQVSYNHFQEIEWSQDKISETLENISVSSIPDEVFLGLFHQSPIVYTTAATTLYNIDPSRTSYFLSNFGENRASLLEILQNSKGQLDGTILEKIKYLKRLKEFYNVSVDILIFLADFVELEDAIEGNEIQLIRNNQEDIVWVYKGILFDKISKTKFSKNEIIISGLNLPEDAHLEVLKSGKLIRAKRAKYFNTLAMHEDLIRNIFTNISK